MGLAIASMLGAMALTPAFADNDGGHDNGRHYGQQRGENRGDWTRHRGDRDRHAYRDSRGALVYRYGPDPYYYAAPVYAPRPYYHAPQPSPGISLFFPLDFRN